MNQTNRSIVRYLVLENVPDAFFSPLYTLCETITARVAKLRHVSSNELKWRPFSAVVPILLNVGPWSSCSTEQLRFYGAAAFLGRNTISTEKLDFYGETLFLRSSCLFLRRNSISTEQLPFYGESDFERA